MKKIIVVDGGKGGVGKSIVASCVIDTITQHLHRNVYIEDADPANADVGKMYDNVVPCAYADLDEQSGFLDLIDTVKATSTDYVVVNCPARALAWREHGQLLVDSLPHLDASLTVLWTLSRQRDSLEALHHYHAALPSVCIHPVVNTYWGTQTAYELWNDSNIKTEILGAGGVEVIMPACADRVVDLMRQTRRAWHITEGIPVSHLVEVQRFRRLAHAALVPIL